MLFSRKGFPDGLPPLLIRPPQNQPLAGIIDRRQELLQHAGSDDPVDRVFSAGESAGETLGRQDRNGNLFEGHVSDFQGGRPGEADFRLFAAGERPGHGGKGFDAEFRGRLRVEDKHVGAGVDECVEPFILDFDRDDRQRVRDNERESGLAEIPGPDDLIGRRRAKRPHQSPIGKFDFVFEPFEKLRRFRELVRLIIDKGQLRLGLELDVDFTGIKGRAAFYIRFPLDHNGLKDNPDPPLATARR